jgi:ABC-type sugar transport system substrate-binding protein
MVFQMMLTLPVLRASLFAALLLAAGATSAFAADSVNSYTPQQMAHAKELVAKKGRQVVGIENVQDGNFFFIAVANGLAYLVTVTASGEVYFSNGLPVRDSIPTS